jgi:hypothetical protein
VIGGPSPVASIFESLAAFLDESAFFQHVFGLLS